MGKTLISSFSYDLILAAAILDDDLHLEFLEGKATLSL